MKFLERSEDVTLIPWEFLDAIFLIGISYNYPGTRQLLKLGVTN